MREVDRHEPGGQQVGRNIPVALRRRPTGGTLLGNRRKAMVRRQDDIRVAVQALLLQRRQQLGQVVIGVPDRGQRGRAVDPRDQPPKAVALVVLRAVGVTRPEHHHERRLALLEPGQHGFRRDVGRRSSAGRRWRPACPRPCWCPTCRCRHVKAPASAAPPPSDACFSASDSGTPPARPVMSSTTIVCCPVRSVWSKISAGPSLPDRRRGQPRLARRAQDGLLVQVVAGEVLVDVRPARGRSPRNGVRLPPAPGTGNPE